MYSLIEVDGSGIKGTLWFPLSQLFGFVSHVNISTCRLPDKIEWIMEENKCYSFSYPLYCAIDPIKDNLKIHVSIQSLDLD